MQRQKNRYIYNGKEQFGNLTEKWFDTNTVNAVDYSSVSNFFDGEFKSKRQVNEHLKSILKTDKKTYTFEVMESKPIRIDGLSYETTNKEFSFDCTENEKIQILKSNPHIKEKSGEKHNKGKLPMSKLFVQFPDALQAVILASCYGHNKYKEVDVDWLNFKKVPGGSQAYKDACLRHSLGAEKDEESGLPEIVHQAWNKLAELQLWLEENNINIKKFSKEYLDNLK